MSNPFQAIEHAFHPVGQAVAHFDPAQAAKAIEAHIQHEVLEKIPSQVHGAIKSELLDVGEAAAKEAFRFSCELARKTYNKLGALRSSRPDLVSDIDLVSMTVSLSVVTLEYSGFYSRAEGLCNLLDQMHQNFKLRRSFVKNLIINSGPTSANITVSGEIFTSAISAGAGITVPISLLAELVDLALAEVGIPE